MVRGPSFCPENVPVTRIGSESGNGGGNRFLLYNQGGGGPGGHIGVDALARGRGRCWWCDYASSNNVGGGGGAPRVLLGALGRVRGSTPSQRSHTKHTAGGLGIITGYPYLIRGN